MEAKELRIGNLFIEEHSEQIIEVIGLTEKEITFTGKFPYKWQSKPIPLIEEWLLNLGFKKHHADFYNDVIMLKPIKLNNNEFEIYFYPPVLGSASTGRFQRIYFVHQLQNLYYALTGNELTIKN